MAVWQFDFYIVNQNSALIYDENKSFDDNEDLLSWEKQKVCKESIATIAKLLPVEKSWSKKIEQYGKIDETCIKLFILDETFCQISCRLDLRNLSRVLLFEIVEFIKMNRGTIVYNNKCYPAEESVLLNLLRESNAYKFCKDPEGFLTSLKTEKH